ncbi:helix-turn-helix transcriptional regulator [Novosphingobium profundi]|nr:helix-turn-helix transcriptional regulator [Novosphingobium profundi]
MPYSKTHGWLSNRQIECLRLVMDGKSSKEIARELEIAPSTVDNHIKLALARLNCETRRQAAHLIESESAFQPDDKARRN